MPEVVACKWHSVAVLSRFCCPLLQVEAGDFTWEAGSSEASLSAVSFEALPCSLTMIVGTVGSGKSSVLAALIGQMERVKGTVAMGGKVAYVAQTAWIINDSVQVGCGCWQAAGGLVAGPLRVLWACCCIYIASVSCCCDH